MCIRVHILVYSLPSNELCIMLLSLHGLYTVLTSLLLGRHGARIIQTSALVGGEWLASRAGRFTPGGRAPGTNWIRDWVGPRAGLDDIEKILDPTGTRTPNPRSSSPLLDTGEKAARLTVTRCESCLTLRKEAPQKTFRLIFVITYCWTFDRQYGGTTAILCNVKFSTLTATALLLRHNGRWAVEIVNISCSRTCAFHAL
jgi:hypothetical protein